MRATSRQAEVIHHMLQHNAYMQVSCGISWRGNISFRDSPNHKGLPVLFPHRSGMWSDVASNCFRAMLRRGYLELVNREIDEENVDMYSWYELTDKGRAAL
jgi:hypothetical protein